ncbi:MAG TPA: hypothetical protein VNA16_05255 [Abditibacteriaceae bacterium]|nr:hypothetical protein [Abditibacteriaceae bacterium]
MPKVTFDANIFVARKVVEQLPDRFYLSRVVLQELVAGAQDETEVKALNVVRREYEKAQGLLVPNSEDWWLAGKVINSLQRGLKAQRGGLTPNFAHPKNSAC